MTLKEMLEQRAQLGHQIRQMADAAEGRDFSAEEQEKWDKLNADYDALTRDIERKKRGAVIEAEMEARETDLPGREDRDGREAGGSQEVTDEQRATAMEGWLRFQSGLDLEERHEEAARACRLNPASRNLDIHLHRRAPMTIAEARALSAIDGSSGGVLAPGDFMRTLEVALLQFGGMLRTSEIIRTDHGNPITWPTTDDTSNTGEIVGENKDVTEQDVAFGARVWGAYKFSSKLIKVPQELLEDAAFDVPGILGQMLGERIGRRMNTAFTTGSGGAEPFGLVSRTTSGKTAASATAIAADELIDLLHSVDPAYRAGDGVGWQMRDSTLAAIRKLKGSDNNYLWQPGLQGGEPDVLLNHGYTVNQDMPAIAATAKTIAFGSLRHYKVRQVRSIRIRRLVERYAEKDQEGFVAFLRGDGDLLDAGTNPVKHLTQAA